MARSTLDKFRFIGFCCLLLEFVSLVLLLAQERADTDIPKAWCIWRSMAGITWEMLGLPGKTTGKGAAAQTCDKARGGRHTRAPPILIMTSNPCSFSSCATTTLRHMPMASVAVLRMVAASWERAGWEQMEKCCRRLRLSGGGRSGSKPACMPLLLPSVVQCHPSPSHR